MSNVLVVFAKAPIEGQVKTRLCPPLTPAQAAKLATCFLLDTVERACTFPETQVYIAFTPAESENVFRALLPFPVHYLPQRGDSLGERELNIFIDLQQGGASRIVLIGSDIPTLPLAHIQEAFTLLEDALCDAVFNPTDDGGYCLIGMREPHSVLFEGIAWSTSTVMAETLARARKHSLTVELAPAWYDVDDRTGLSRLANELSNTKEGTVAPRTQALLRRLGLFPEHEPE
jgi:rSAM/selenodomain-associated transferase 1